ncbi:MAG: hypothetical protein AXW14_08015 [Alteromonas sp. Nap_26]|nr:MAG: hypothetical protein AXW14_08015 [Alteromonas sp. Nap_26]
MKRLYSSVFLLFLIITFSGLGNKVKADCGVIALSDSTQSIDTYNDCTNPGLVPHNPISPVNSSKTEYSLFEFFDVIIPF